MDATGRPNLPNSTGASEIAVCCRMMARSLYENAALFRIPHADQKKSFLKPSWRWRSRADSAGSLKIAVRSYNPTSPFSPIFALLGSESSKSIANSFLVQRLLRNAMPPLGELS